ncbi:hypothetical protein DV735_g4767, partial [Chaetothyriales sp. CBS 134920]
MSPEKDNVRVVATSAVEMNDTQKLQPLLAEHVVTPKVAWYLRFNRQLVLIGLFLGLMEMCVEDVRKDAFLSLENGRGSTPGPKRRQNSWALLTHDFWGLSWRWRGVVGFFTLLPLVLAIGYKQFLGGNTTRQLSAGEIGASNEYGIDFPRVGTWAPPNDSIYLLLTSFAPFQTASEQGKGRYPTEFPQAYGYNTLLLGNDSAAILDIPSQQYMTKLQDKLGDGDYFEISATVDAYVATWNTSTPSFVANDTLWDQAFEKNIGMGLSRINLYVTGRESLGILPFDDEGTTNPRIFIGFYYDSPWAGISSHTNRSDPEVERFRQRAQLYNLSRQRCQGKWQLNSTSILLLAGDCSSSNSSAELPSPDILEPRILQPFEYDILPPLMHTYEYLVDEVNRIDSPWLRATYSTSVATMYWARGLYMFDRAESLRPARFRYSPTEEAVGWTRPTLRNHPLLYTILVIQPVIVFGTAGVGNYPPFNTTETIQQAFQILEKHNVKNIDTAQLYGNSEKTLGEEKAGSKFTIDTKWASGFNPAFSPTKENIIKSAKESLEKLGVSQVDVFYIHAPDKNVPLEDTLAGVNEVYKSGAFKRFGLSNFAAADVQKAYDIAKANGYVLPTVYQANYNPIARKQETILFPTLRKLGISIYVYSPLAGGFLTKTKEDIDKGAGRFNANVLGGLYHSLYARPTLLAVLPKWAKIAEDAGVSKSELAYRWVAYHSAIKKEDGDAVIVGASSPNQLEQTLTDLEKGPLPESAVKGIQEIWTEIEHESPVDNYHK